MRTLYNLRSLCVSFQHDGHAAFIDEGEELPVEILLHHNKNLCSYCAQKKQPVKAAHIFLE